MPPYLWVAVVVVVLVVVVLVGVVPVGVVGDDVVVTGGVPVDVVVLVGLTVVCVVAVVAVVDVDVVADDVVVGAGGTVVVVVVLVDFEQPTSAMMITSRDASSENPSFLMCSSCQIYWNGNLVHFFEDAAGDKGSTVLVVTSSRVAAKDKKYLSLASSRKVMWRCGKWRLPQSQ